MDESITIVKSLLAVLPDSVRDSDKLSEISDEPTWTGGDCWEWCWNELSDDAQEEVKAVRQKALAWLKQNEVQNGQSDD